MVDYGRRNKSASIFILGESMQLKILYKIIIQEDGSLIFQQLNGEKIIGKNVLEEIMSKGQNRLFFSKTDAHGYVLEQFIDNNEDAPKYLECSIHGMKYREDMFCVLCGKKEIK